MPANRSDLTLFRLFGAPVKIHWSVLSIVLLGLLFSRDPLVLASGLAAYLLLIFVHEAGHAWVARRNGLRVHELLIFPLHGWCLYQTAHSRGQEIAVAWGGVAAQALLFALAVALSKLAPNPSGPLGQALGVVVLVWGPLNLLNAVVNLIPVKPFDGYTTWAVLPWLWQRGRSKFHARSMSSTQVPLPKDVPTHKPSGGKVVSIDEHRKRRR